MSSQGTLFALSREQTGVLKGLAILMVLLEHTWYVSFLGPVGVGIFLALSGYGLELSCEKNGRERYWNKRIRKVWLPYMLVGTFVVLALRVGGALPILCNVIGLDLGRLADRTMWYISYILLWYLGYDLAYRVSALAPEGPVRQGLKLLLLLAAAFGFRLLAGLGFWHPDANAGVYGFCFPPGRSSEPAFEDPDLGGTQDTPVARDPVLVRGLPVSALSLLVL